MNYDRTERPPENIPVGDVSLVKWRDDQLDALHGAVQESLEHLMPWMEFASRSSRESQREFIANVQLNWTLGTEFGYAILSAEGEVIGSCGLMSRIDPGGLEIGYWVHAEHTGRAVATRATAALSEAAFELPAITHVEIHHDEANHASGAVPARLGFELIGAKDSPLLAPANTGTDLMWRLRASDYPSSGCPRILALARAD